VASSGSYQYLYERLGDKRFQQLCAALVLDRYPNVSVFPVGEKDGGRDMVSGTGENRTVLQVKWSGNRSKKSTSWLRSAVNGEAANIKRLVSEGCTQYVLMTNVEGSAAPGSGTRDQIEEALDDLGKQYGIPMSCVWAADLDAWVTNSPWEIRATYLEMLAGSDLLLALLDAKSLEDREKRERDILVTYVATHWDRDKRVKFRQVDLASDLLTDLFVDVTAHRARSPWNTTLSTIDIGGVAHHLLDPAAPPLALIEGVPGQGKSTIAQYVCQVHRAGFIGRDQLADRKESLPTDETADLRVAILIDLADYAEWIGGHDPYASTDSTKKAKQRAKIGLERFLVAHFEYAAPGHDIGVDDVRAILDRYPTQVFLDGLDEVASAGLREKVVREIDEFTTRWAQARPGKHADRRHHPSERIRPGRACPGHLRATGAPAAQRGHEEEVPASVGRGPARRRVGAAHLGAGVRRAHRCPARRPVGREPDAADDPAAPDPDQGRVPSHRPHKPLPVIHGPVPGA